MNTDRTIIGGYDTTLKFVFHSDTKLSWWALQQANNVMDQDYYEW